MWMVQKWFVICEDSDLYSDLFLCEKKFVQYAYNRRKNEKMWLEILFYLKMNLFVILVKFAQQQFLIALCDKHVKYVLQVISVFLVLFSCVEDCIKNIIEILIYIIVRITGIFYIPVSLYFRG